MDKKTKPILILPTKDSLQLKSHTQTERDEKIYFMKIEINKQKARVAILTLNKIVFKTKAISRDKEKPSNSTSGSVFKQTQNTTLKGYMNPYIYCSFIYNNQNIVSLGNLGVH